MKKRIIAFITVAFLCLGCESDQPENEQHNTPNIKTCDATQNACISEREVSHCVGNERMREYCPDGQRCFNGECGAVMCTPNTIERCEANGQWYGCNPLGTGKGAFDCKTGLTCVDQKCVTRVCQAGEGRCLDEDTILLCNEAGTAYEVTKKCQDISPKTVCEEGQCISICEKTTKNASYIGCEYWAVDLDNALDPGGYDAAGQPFAVVLSNTHETLEANVQIITRKNNTLTTMLDFVIPPKSIKKAILPDGCYDGGVSCPEASAVNATSITQMAYHIKSDLPITAAQFNPLDNVGVFSNDASLLFPTTALGKRYMIMARKQNYDVFSAFATIVAVEPGQTEVKFKSSCSIRSGWDKNGGEISAMKKGQTQTFILDQYDVLNLETAAFGEDPTGSVITANKNIAVFAGVEATSIPEREALVCGGSTGLAADKCCITCCADHIEHQQYPLGAWGKEYNAAKLKARNMERDVWRILSRTDGTRVTTTPNVFETGTQGFDGTALTLNAGQWIDITTRESFNIHASSPVLVGQFMTGSDDPMNMTECRLDNDWRGAKSAGIGDPAYIIGVPIEQYRKQYTFLAPSDYINDYVSIVAPVGTTVVLDGETLPQSDFIPFGDEKYAVAYKLIEDGRHDLTASERVGLFSYGVDSYVSYGYPAGLDLRELFDE